MLLVFDTLGVRLGISGAGQTIAGSRDCVRFGAVLSVDALYLCAGLVGNGFDFPCGFSCQRLDFWIRCMCHRPSSSRHTNEAGLLMESAIASTSALVNRAQSVAEFSSQP